MVHRENSTAAGARTRTLAVPLVDFGILVDHRSNVCNENGRNEISKIISGLATLCAVLKCVLVSQTIRDVQRNDS